MKKENLITTIPYWYNPYLHAIVPSVFGLSIISICVTLISHTLWYEWLSIPIMLLSLFLFEWCAHKYILHTKQSHLEQIYQLHELAHHIIYTDKKMEIKDKRELYFVMMPPYAIMLVFCLVAPLVFFIGLVFSTNVAALLMITSMVFFLLYEWLHFFYHLPSDSIIGKNKIIRFLRETHKTHHNPRLMKHCNFNVTVPIFDWILGTYCGREK